MMKLRIVGAAVGAVAISTFLAVSARATGTENRTAYLTFSGAVALPGVELAAGTYTFELVSPNTDPTLVRVTSRDHQKVYILHRRSRTTWRVRRVRTGTTSSPSAKASRGQAPRITAWFPTDESMGREFVY